LLLSEGWFARRILGGGLVFFLFGERLQKESRMLPIPRHAIKEGRQDILMSGIPTVKCESDPHGPRHGMFMIDSRLF
jgi:hypothetical protein